MGNNYNSFIISSVFISRFFFVHINQKQPSHVKFGNPKAPLLSTFHPWQRCQNNPGWINCEKTSTIRSDHLLLWEEKISGSKQHNFLPHLEQSPPNIYLETIIWWDGTTAHGNYIAKTHPEKNKKHRIHFWGPVNPVKDKCPPHGVDYNKHLVSINSPKSQRSYRFYREGCLEQNHQTFRSEFDAPKKTMQSDDHLKLSLGATNYFWGNLYYSKTLGGGSWIRNWDAKMINFEPWPMVFLQHSFINIGRWQ